MWKVMWITKNKVRARYLCFVMGKDIIVTRKMP